VLAERYPGQAEFVLAQRKCVSALKDKLQSVKHNERAGRAYVGDLVRVADGIVRALLR
jgi:hypothetical protein